MRKDYSDLDKSFVLRVASISLHKTPRDIYTSCKFAPNARGFAPEKDDALFMSGNMERMYSFCAEQSGARFVYILKTSETTPFQDERRFISFLFLMRVWCSNAKLSWLPTLLVKWVRRNGVKS